MKKILLVGLLLLSVAACEEKESAPTADSDSNQNYAKNSKIPVDDEIYTITGTVADSVENLTRQESPGKGSLTGFGNYTTGTYFGPVESGKGYVRLKVQNSQPRTDLATEGNISVLKVTDTKATALLPGDIVTFKCRRQYEALAAVKENQKFDEAKVATWELDFCRLASPVITVKK